MGAYIDGEAIQPTDGEEAPELLRWLSVSGDMDDFIYYGETAKNHSER